MYAQNLERRPLDHHGYSHKKVVIGLRARTGSSHHRSDFLGWGGGCRTMALSLAHGLTTPGYHGKDAIPPRASHQ